MKPLEWKPLSVMASRGQTGSRVSLECRACHRLLHRSLGVSAFAVTHSRCLRSCSVLGGVIKPPLPSFLTPTSVQQGSFAPRALPRFIATASPAATVSSSADFPGSPVIRPTWLRRFLGRDEDGFSSCSTCSCHRAARNHPAGVASRLGQPAARHAAFAPQKRARPPVFNFLWTPPLGSLALRPGDSLTILIDGFVGRLHPLRFLRGCDASYEGS